MTSKACNITCGTNSFKGYIYEGEVHPCTTCAIVSMGAEEASIESVSTDFVTLRSIGNVFDSETMVEGALCG